MVGKTLGHYEILEPLGKGGMGEVYRARDTKLDRDVAIKVLHENLAADSALLARFEREARLLAALNHPNIAVIHGLEEASGVRFLVLELVAGESLAEVLSRGALPTRRALELAGQIAGAIEAAHDGVTARSLGSGAREPRNPRAATRTRLPPRRPRAAGRLRLVVLARPQR